mmetsp:Transcript_13735/g.33269  ORF Transcript_13735/g.33269 Transcript_13735/m.33269 type:complete len:363 (-) Transcript_13735:1091-2179(-)
MKQEETKAKIISGAVGSFLTAFAVHPLEVVKVRTQAQRTPVSAAVRFCSPECVILNNGLGDFLLPKSSLNCMDPTCGTNKTVKVPRGTQRGIFGSLRHIFFKEGVGSLYAGLGPTLTMGVPNTIIYFLTYDELSRKMSQRNLDSQWTPAVAGAAARSIASLSTAPLELVRTIQASRPQSNGMLSEFQMIVKQEGVVGLYRGLAPSLMRDVPFSSIYWMSIEYCRNKWLDHDSNRHRVDRLSAVEHAGRALFNGTVSGLIAAACTTPLDVIKTNQQLQVEVVASPTTVLLSSAEGTRSMHTAAATPTAKPTNFSSLDIAKRILAEEGIQGFWRGNVARMTKVAPACACMIASYEVGQKLYLTE